MCFVVLSESRSWLCKSLKSLVAVDLLQREREREREKESETEKDSDREAEREAVCALISLTC